MKFLLQLLLLGTAASAAMVPRTWDDWYDWHEWPQYKDWKDWCPKPEQCDKMHEKCPCPPPPPPPPPKVEYQNVYVTKYVDKWNEKTVTCTETKYVDKYKTETCYVTVTKEYCPPKKDDNKDWKPW